MDRFQIPVKYIVYTQVMAVSALLKKIPYPLRNEWPQLLLWNKETQYPEKNCSLRLNVLTYKEEHFFKNNYFEQHAFLMNLYICQ